MPKMKTLRQLSLTRALPWLLIIDGAIGLLCSFILTVEKMQVLKDPNFHPICDLNPVLSCGSVMDSSQSHVLGFDNTFMGLAGFAVIVTIGVVLLAGAQLKRWFWLGLQGGLTAGILFVHWLMFNSLYVINSLCPFCMIVWIVIITLFTYVTLYNIQQGNITVKGRAKQIYEFARRHHLDIIFMWLLIIAALILHRFWYYYGPKLGF
jgi:uncharacterized membrane protein